MYEATLLLSSTSSDLRVGWEGSTSVRRCSLDLNNRKPLLSLAAALHQLSSATEFLTVLNFMLTSKTQELCSRLHLLHTYNSQIKMWSYCFLNDAAPLLPT